MLWDGQSDLINQKTWKQEQLRQVVNSETSTVSAEDASDSVRDLQTTTPTDTLRESISWNAAMKEGSMGRYYQSAKFESEREKGYNARMKLAAKYPHI